MPEAQLQELVVFSLEPWDHVWRRNQFFVDILLRRTPRLRVLFVEPPTDPIHALRLRTAPRLPRLRRVSADGRLRALTPLKPLPRRLGSLSDDVLLTQARLGIRLSSFRSPVLWLNDTTYAPLIEKTGLPSVYDMTDDWLLAPLPHRELARLEALERIVFEHADEVVVCSPGLLASRGSLRPLTLVPNGVDTDRFAQLQARPVDLPRSPVAVYVGSLHESRLDVDLVAHLAECLPDLAIALVGPDSLSASARARLGTNRRIALLGAKPYETVPGYLQHADVIIIPHVVSAFTESLDPIKAYECLASRRPTVATPVAGFRELADRISIVPPERFAAAVRAALSADGEILAGSSPPTWLERAEAFEHVLLRAQATRIRNR